MKRVFLLFGIAILLACNEDTDGPMFGPFEGVKLFDENGEPLGCYGPCGDDWTDTELSEEEMALLDFQDTITLSMGLEPGVDHFHPYPSPISNTGNMAFFVDGQGAYKIKMNMVDEAGKSAFKTTIKIQNGGSVFQLSSNIFESLERKKIYRIYYIMLNHSDTKIYSGYGDFAICELDHNPTFDTCF